MRPHVTFRVLGPLEVLVDGRAVAITAGKVRTVLAALLLQANRTVTIDGLVDKLWDEREPRNGRSTVQKYVMRLRHVLDGLGAGHLIGTQPDGYRMSVAPGQLDLDRFTDLMTSWEQAARREDTREEAPLLAEALGLWSAVPPMANVPSMTVQRHEAAGLVERYLLALDRRIELDLQQGRHSEVLAELIHLTRRYPHRERFWAHRIRALHRSGRQGEALTVHREVSRLLADELGVDPGPELRSAHQEMLADT
ncbi:MAG: AfsR/SARP family transcriptional regulator, partial [Actinomycetes bacterium]